MKTKEKKCHDKEEEADRGRTPNEIYSITGDDAWAHCSASSGYYSSVGVTDVGKMKGKPVEKTFTPK